MERHHKTESNDEMDSESEQDTREVDNETVTNSDGSTRPRDIFDDAEDESEESSIEDDPTDSEDDEKPQPGRDRIVNNVLTELNTRREVVVDYLVGQGRDEKEAKEEAYESMLPAYQKEFRQQLGDAFELIEEIRREPLYKIVMDRAKQLRLDGLGRTESIRAAIRDRKYKVNEFFPDKYESDDEEDEEHEEDEEQ